MKRARSQLASQGKAETGGNVMFSFEVNFAGVFRLLNIPQENLQPVMMIECPRMLFPFAREIVATSVRNGGFPPLLLDPIDFVSLYQQRMQAPNLPLSRSDSKRRQASVRSFGEHCTESMPNRETPLKMKGATLPGRSIPAARPQAATTPPYLVMERTLASVAEPTESTAAAQRSLASGLGGPLSSARSMISFAPSPLR